MQGGDYKITITALNPFGEDQEIIDLSVSEVSGFSHSIELSLAGYSGSQALSDFPMLVRMDRSMDESFSLNSFASDYCNDLRFFDTTGRNLSYEIESIDRTNNILLAWVRVPNLDSTESIFAYWGNADLANTAPDFSTDGSTWSAGYRGVWHYRPMEDTDVLTDSTWYRNHSFNQAWSYSN